jgi:hypothetical protein
MAPEIPEMSKQGTAGKRKCITLEFSRTENNKEA